MSFENSEKKYFAWFYRLPFLKDSTTITIGPSNTIIPKDTSCPITCQLIIL